MDLQLPMQSVNTKWVQIPFSPGVLDTTLCDEICQWLVAGQWFSLGTPISSINKTDCHDMTKILLKVVLNTITLTPRLNSTWFFFIEYNKSLVKWSVQENSKKRAWTRIRQTRANDRNKSLKWASERLCVTNQTYYFSLTVWYKNAKLLERKRKIEALNYEHQAC